MNAQRGFYVWFHGMPMPVRMPYWFAAISQRNPTPATTNYVVNSPLRQFRSPEQTNERTSEKKGAFIVSFPHHQIEASTVCYY